MGFYATDTLEAAPPRRTSSTRARRDPACGQKPLRGPTRGAISGYRFYSPEMGRWVNRDPIGELGGLNVYMAINNAAINEYDLLGMSSCGFTDDSCRPCKPGECSGKRQKKDKEPDGCSSGIFGDDPVRRFSGHWGCSFLDCCNKHDCCYGNCFGPSKGNCDYEFYKCMLRVCRSFRCILGGGSSSCLSWATRFYMAVVVGGGSAYDGNKSEHCEGCDCP